MRSIANTLIAILLVVSTLTPVYAHISLIEGGKHLVSTKDQESFAIAGTDRWNSIATHFRKIRQRESSLGQSFDSLDYHPNNKAHLVVWGNYCGLGNRGNNYEEDPVDDIDAICMVHDLCYEARGRFDCACDEAIAADARELYEFYSRDGNRKKAYFSRLIWLTFKSNSCR